MTNEEYKKYKEEEKRLLSLVPEIDRTAAEFYLEKRYDYYFSIYSEEKLSFIESKSKANEDLERIIRNEDWLNMYRFLMSRLITN